MPSRRCCRRALSGFALAGDGQALGHGHETIDVAVLRGDGAGQGQGRVAVRPEVQLVAAGPQAAETADVEGFEPLAVGPAILVADIQPLQVHGQEMIVQVDQADVGRAG